MIHRHASVIKDGADGKKRRRTRRRSHEGTGRQKTDVWSDMWFAKGGKLSYYKNKMLEMVDT